MCRLDNLDPGSTQKLLMKTGLILIVIGHLNFITGALVHGMVLRHIANPQDSISLNYAISNVVMVTSAILTISCGIAAIVLSRYVSRKSLVRTFSEQKRPCGKEGSLPDGFAVSFSCLQKPSAGPSPPSASAVPSSRCSAWGGLAVCIVLTFANRGRALLAMCTFADMELIQIAHECPFDPTRIYSSALVLWSLSFLLDGVETVFSVRCFLLTLLLLNVRLCHRRTRKKKAVPCQPPPPLQPQHTRPHVCHPARVQVLLQLVPAESRAACEGRNLLRTDRVETVWL
ncbi:hypothetical protein lerEdw1_007210 [Lerista edwardsae]|nr:hypothetical protein lerEdw1_007210 [Lerista edwardsae]